MDHLENMRNGYGHMVHDYFVDRVRQVHKSRDKVLSSIDSCEDVHQYQQKVRRAIREAFAPFPEKTALNPVVTGTIERKGYRIEKLTFESRPGVLVTANLYVPSQGKGKYPGIIGTCGHSADGKAEPKYQEFCQRLVQCGFVVLIYDPISQGERDQYINCCRKEDKNLSGTHAHNMMGKQLELIGEFFGSWRAWDGIRALDYLLTRPEVDAERVGVTGNSGGGTMTTWLWALEERFTMAAPSCFVTTFLNNLENELPADSEQCPPGVLGNGLEMADFLIARAPRPLIILGQNYDYFDRRGLKQAYDDVEKIYTIMGKEDNVDWFIGDNPHGYHPDAQEQMVSFFCRHAGVAEVEPNIDILSPEELFATETGEVIEAGAKPVFVIIKEKGEEAAGGGEQKRKPDLRTAVAEALNIPPADHIPHYRALRPTTIQEICFSRYAVETEANLRVIMKKFQQSSSLANSLDVEETISVYIPNISSEGDILKGDVSALDFDKRPLYLLDVRGLGETMPDDTRGFLHPYGMDYLFHVTALMLGESYLGRRVYDCLCTLNLLRDEGADTITLIGRGQGAVIALFASLFEDSLEKVVLKDLPSSFEEWTCNPVVKWPAANFPRAILDICDIPDCIREIGDGVEVTGHWDFLMHS